MYKVKVRKNKGFELRNCLSYENIIASRIGDLLKINIGLQIEVTVRREVKSYSSINDEK